MFVSMNLITNRRHAIAIEFYEFIHRHRVTARLLILGACVEHDVAVRRGLRWVFVFEVGI